MKNAKRSVEGVVVPLVTPVKENGEIDFRGLETLVGWLARKGIDGVFVAGTTGRFSHFSPAQNGKICRVVTAVVGGTLTVYGGCCDSGLHRTLANAELMKKAGADMAVVTAPYYLSYSIQEAEANLERVLDSSPLPVILYNIPEFIGYSLRPEWLESVSEHPNAVGYKDSTNDLEHHLDVLKRTKGKIFSVLIGKELLLSAAFVAGARGLVLSFANVFPEPFVELVKAARISDWETVEKNQQIAREIVENFLLKRTGKYFSSLMLYLQQEFHNRGIDLRLL